jgi:hypothetical protein
MSSKAFSFNKEDGVKILQAFGYSLASASLAALIAFLAMPDLQVPQWAVPLVPIVNALLYGGKRFVDGRSV